MPQRRSLFSKPDKAPDVSLPESGEDNIIDQAMRALMVAMGIEEQAPGDLPGAMGGMMGAGAMGAMRGSLGKMLKFPPKFKNPDSIGAATSDLSPKLMNEFHLMSKQPPAQAPIEHDEIRKLLDLLNLK